MAVIGIACKSDRFSYVILDGISTLVKLKCCETYHLTQKEAGKNLEYARNQIRTIINKYSLNKAAFMVEKSLKKKGFGGNFITVNIPIHQYYIEGVIIDELYNNHGIKIVEFDKNAELKDALEKKLSLKISEHPAKIIDFMKKHYEELATGKMNDFEREAFTVAVATL